MTSQLTIHEMALHRSHARRLHKADRAYRVDEALGARPRTRSIEVMTRQAVGTALIVAGEWMRGQSRVASSLSAPSVAR